MKKRPVSTLTRPDFDADRFVVVFVVEKGNRDHADCPGLSWTFGNYSSAKQLADKAIDMLRYGSFGSAFRRYPFVSIFDRKTEKRYDYEV